MNRPPVGAIIRFYDKEVRFVISKDKQVVLAPSSTGIGYKRGEVVSDLATQTGWGDYTVICDLYIIDWEKYC